MLKANKSKWFESLFTIYNRNLLRRRFNSFRIRGLEKLQDRPKNIPTIIFANHSSWWDGLVAFQIAKEVDANFYVLMEEKQLKDLQLFRKLGAFSVVREKPRSALQSINYAVDILKNNPKAMLCIFPQGEILHNDFKPIKFYNGVSRIIEKTVNCQVFSLSMRYEFTKAFKPEIFVNVSEGHIFPSIHIIESKKLTTKLEQILTKNLDDLKKSIINGKITDFQDII